jgi:hypothetical protein
LTSGKSGKGYRFSEKDEAIISFIMKFGAVDSFQIAQIFYRGKSQSEVLARAHLNKIAKAKETLIEKSKERNPFSGRFDYYLKAGQVNHKKKIVDFYIALLHGPGEILEFTPEYTIGDIRADAFIAYQYGAGPLPIRLYFLEVQLSNIKPDLKKYERLKLSGEWEPNKFPTVVIVSRVNFRLKSDLIDFYQLPITLNEWEKILKIKPG